MTTPATLLIGFDPRTCLAISRSLHRMGVKVIVGLISEWETPLASRSIAEFIKLPGIDREPKEFLEKLLGTIELYGIDTLLPTNDRALRLLAPHRDLLDSNLAIACPTSGQLEVILDKAATARLADRLHIPVPTAFLAHELSALHECHFPLFAKLRDKADQDLLADPCDPAVAMVEDYKSAEILFRKYGRENLLFQEYVRGDDVGLALLMKQGACAASFQYRAERLYPAAGGVCVVAITEHVDPQMYKSAVSLLKALRWEGVAQLDFRHDPKSGRFVLLEVNGRFWGSHQAAITAGMDFPKYAYELLHGRESEIPAHYKIGHRARWLEGDLRRLRALFKQRNYSSWALVRECFTFLKDFMPGVSAMYWSWWDPYPAFKGLAATGVYWTMGKRKRRRAFNSPKLAKIA